MQINKTVLRDLFIFIHVPWQRYLRLLNYQKSEVCVFNLRVAIFGSRVRERNTAIKNCVGCGGSRALSKVGPTHSPLPAGVPLLNPPLNSRVRGFTHHGDDHCSVWFLWLLSERCSQNVVDKHFRYAGNHVLSFCVILIERKLKCVQKRVWFFPGRGLMKELVSQDPAFRGDQTGLEHRTPPDR